MNEWKFEYSATLTKKLKKLKKKDLQQFRIIMKKKDDVKSKVVLNPDHFKNLRYALSEFKRVHIDTHFVLVFTINKNSKVVRFVDYDHHDNIYARK